MGDYSPPETPKEMVETLRAMAHDRSFRLSQNERAAIAYALRRLTEREVSVPLELLTGVLARAYSNSHCVESQLACNEKDHFESETERALIDDLRRIAGIKVE